MNNKKLYTFLLILLTCYLGFSQNIIYVNTNATGTNDGTSWTNAYTNLQPALDAAAVGDNVWVAAGTYYPTQSSHNSTDTRNFAFHFSVDILLYGGFTGTETSITERGAGNITFLSGDIGVANDNTDNTYSVMVTIKLSNSAVIDGFTITGGNARLNGTSYYYNGTASEYVVTNYSGGGMQNIFSKPSINNVFFTNNTVVGGGGAIYNNESDVRISNCVFTNNTAGVGGAIDNDDSDISISNTFFANNTAEYNGGAIDGYTYSMSISNCVFTDNNANDGYGGAINSSFTLDISISNTIFTNNSVNDGDGGAIRAFYTSSIAIYNTVFWNNTANNVIEDIDYIGSKLTGNNNASDGNRAPATTGTLITLTTDPFSDSTNPKGTDDIYGTIDDGLRPSLTSILINVGDNAQNSETLDIIENPRTYSNTIDIGAYEIQVDDNPFITTWQTTTNTESITIPTRASGEGLTANYDYIITWGDGTTDYNQTGDATHTYSTAGIYTVSIYGDFQRIYFNGGTNGQDNEKILTIEQWGGAEWVSMQKAFNGCTNLNITNASIDNPDLSNVTQTNNMFRDASSFNGNISSWDMSTVTHTNNMFRDASSFNGNISSWDMSTVTETNNMFRDATAFNQDLSGWVTSSAQTMTNMFNGATAFNQNLSGWDLTNVTNVIDMFNATGISNTNYDNILIGWNNNTNTPDGLDLGNIPASSCDGDTAKTNLTNVKGWTITDEGSNFDCITLSNEGLSQPTNSIIVTYNKNENTMIANQLNTLTINNMELFKISGTLIAKTNNSTNLYIGNTPLASGLYILILTTNKGAISKKIIIN